MATSRNVCRIASVFKQHLNQKNKTRNFSALLSPLYEYPELPFQPGTPSKSSTSQVTTLPSGLIVATEDASFSTTVSVTYPGAGSQNEMLSEGGASLANKNMSFKSGSGLSSLVILRSLENDGAFPYSFSGRYGAGVGFTSSPDKAERLIPLIATKCSYEKWDVRDAIYLSNDIVDEAMRNSRIVLTEQLYTAAYGAQSSLGRSSFLKNTSRESIISFRDRCYVTNGAIIVATGVKDHANFVSVVEDSFSHMSTGAKEEVASTYLGGEARISAKSGGYAQIAIAFKAPSNTALSNVIKHCLSHSTSASPFVAPGLLGLYAASPSAQAGNAVDEMCSAFTQTLTDPLISKAKHLAKAEAVFALQEGSKSLAEAMTQSVLETGSFSFESTSAAYDDISNQMVVTAFAEMIKTNPSLAAVGEIDAVPYKATVAAKFS